MLLTPRRSMTGQHPHPMDGEDHPDAIFLNSRKEPMITGRLIIEAITALLRLLGPSRSREISTFISSQNTYNCRGQNRRPSTAPRRARSAFCSLLVRDRWGDVLRKFQMVRCIAEGWFAVLADWDL